MANMYSVYERGTDRPIFIYGTSRQCAKALGVKLDTFYTYIKRMHEGNPPKKIEIIIEDKDDEEVTAI